MPIEGLRAKLRQPYPQYGLEWWVLIAIAITLIGGVAASVAMSDWGWFARAGSAIVVVGIYVTWKDISGTVDFAQQFLRQMIEKEKAKIGPVKGGLLTAAKNQEIEQQIDTLGGQLEGLLKTMKVRVRALEVGTIMMGTVIWGFGDLIGEIPLG